MSQRSRIAAPIDPRWIRHDAHLWIQPNIERWMKPGVGPADVIPALAQKRAQEQSARRAMDGSRRRPEHHYKPRAADGQRQCR
jgi:hypothetical protein